MAANPDGAVDAEVILVFENDPRQATAYIELLDDAGFDAHAALPDQSVQQICERLKPSAALVEMGIWESDAAFLFGVLNGALGFDRPVILALASLPHQVRRAKKFGADGVWVRGVDDAALLPVLVADLIVQRREGKLKPKTPATPL